MNNIMDTIMAEVKKGDLNLSESEEKIFIEAIEEAKKQKLNIMFVGATGVGKSSTINAIFNNKVAVLVGDFLLATSLVHAVNPETSTIKKYEIDNMILWDTPGLGDSPENDANYAIQMANALKAKDENGNLIVDEVVVLVDGSNRDMGTTYEVIENIIMPYIGDNNRIVIAINQCDMAKKGRCWNRDEGKPEEELVEFLNDKVKSVKNRILESTGVETNPIYYSALYKYNISKLLYTMIKSIPETKRFVVADNLNSDPQIWKVNDDVEEYNKEILSDIKNSVMSAIESASSGAAIGAKIGAKIGSIIPIIGPAVGTTVGTVIGGALGFLGGLFF